MTVEPIALTEPEARRLTERIRAALDRVSSAWSDMAERVAEAYERRADLALGYGSWAEYAEAELQPSGQIAADVRRQLDRLMTHNPTTPTNLTPETLAELRLLLDEAPPLPYRDSPRTHGDPSNGPTYVALEAQLEGRWEEVATGNYDQWSGLGLALAAAAINALPDLLAATGELAHMTEARDNARAEVERLTAKLNAIEADDDKLSIMSGWLVYDVGEHACGGYGPESGYAHEPGCGFEPVLRLDKLEGWPGERDELAAKLNTEGKINSAAGGITPIPEPK